MVQTKESGRKTRKMKIVPAGECSIHKNRRTFLGIHFSGRNNYLEWFWSNKAARIFFTVRTTFS